MILTPLDQSDPRLRQLCAPVSRAMLRERQQQLEVDALLEFVFGQANKVAPGVRRDRSRPTTVGLAANQVGMMKQICALDLSIGHQGYTDFYVLVNPHITWRSKALIRRSEGCVNFGKIWGFTERYRSVRVEALDRSGNELQLHLSGWPAILVQHEVDHLEGRLFIDRMPDPEHAHLVEPEEFVRYRRQREAWGRFIDVSGQVVATKE